MGFQVLESILMEARPNTNAAANDQVSFHNLEQQLNAHAMLSLPDWSPWLLASIIFIAGAGASVTLYRYAEQHNEDIIAAKILHGKDEGKFLAEISFSSLMSTMTSSATSIALLRNASAWTRTSSYFLAENVAKDKMTLSWWEVLPALPELGLSQRLQDMREEYGFQPGETLEPQIYMAGEPRVPLSEYYPDNSTQRRCGPFIRSGSTCVLNPSPKSEGCTVESDCLVMVVHPGNAVPLNVSGSAVFNHAVLGADVSRRYVDHDLLTYESSITERKPISTLPMYVRAKEFRYWGLSLWMPVFNVEDIYSRVAAPRFLGYIASAVQSRVFSEPLASNPSLEYLWWALWDLDSHNVLVSSHDFDTAQPSIEAARQAAHRQSLLASDPITESFTAFGRTWVFEAAATEEARSDLATDTPIYVLTTGLLVTVFLTVLLVVYLKHRHARTRSVLLQEQTKLDAEQRVHDAVLGYVHHELRGPLHIVGACMSEALLLLKRMAKEASMEAESRPHDVLDIARVPSGDYPSLSATKLAALPPEAPPVTALPAESKSSESEAPLISTTATLPRLIKRAQEYLTNGTDASNALSRQLQDLMDLQQLQRGQFECRMAGVDMVSLLRQLVDSLKGSARVPVTLDVAKLQESLRLMGKQQSVGEGMRDEEMLVETDGLRVRQILYTGLMNAINHTGEGYVKCMSWLEGGSTESEAIAIKAAPQTEEKRVPRATYSDNDTAPRSLPSTASACWLLVSVVDTGKRHCSRPSDEATPFAAFDTEKKQLAQLSSDGVGIPLSHLIAAAMGGSVTVTQLDNGCEFRIRLPVTVHVRPKTRVPAFSDMAGLIYTETLDQMTDRPALTEASRDTSAGILGSPSGKAPQKPIPHHVLVVDDVSLNVRLAANMLKRKGHTSECISSGDFLQAISTKLQERRQLAAPSAFDSLRDAPPFTVLFLDIRLGTANGVHILQKLRREWKSSPPAVRPPVVIAMTASTTSEDVGVYKKAGFDGILAKPFSVEKIEALLNNLAGPAVGTGGRCWVEVLG